MPRGRCVFNSKLRARYPFLRVTISESDVTCELCRANINISSGGNSDITRHINTRKHIVAAKEATERKHMKTYLRHAHDMATSSQQKRALKAERNYLPKFVKREKVANDNDTGTDAVAATSDDHHWKESISSNSLLEVAYEEDDPITLSESDTLPDADTTNGFTTATMKFRGAVAKQRMRNDVFDADEKWWIAQYALYLKLNRSQKLQMKKTISELQLKFEYDNIQTEPEIAWKRNSTIDDHADPLDYM